MAAQGPTFARDDLRVFVSPLCQSKAATGGDILYQKEINAQLSLKNVEGELIPTVVCTMDTQLLQGKMWQCYLRRAPNSDEAFRCDLAAQTGAKAIPALFSSGGGHPFASAMQSRCVKDDAAAVEEGVSKRVFEEAVALASAKSHFKRVRFLTDEEAGAAAADYVRAAKRPRQMLPSGP